MVNVNFSPFPILYTERFVLRPLRMEDDVDLFILRTDEKINEFIGRIPPRTLEEVRTFIETIFKNTERGSSILWAISAKGEENLSGTICLWKISTAEEKAEIGYELLPDYHGKGIMQEVIPVVIQFGFKNMGLKTIEAELHRDNIKSLKLLDKNGFVHDAGIVSDHPQMVVYTLCKS